jgi:hypothetical protein
MPGTLVKAKTSARSISHHKFHHQFAQLHSQSAKSSVQQFSRHGAVARLCATALIGCKPYPLSRQGFYGSLISRRKLRGVPRDGRETSGKKSGEMSHVVSAQRPGNGRTVATAMPPNVRPDDWQDNLPCAGQGRQCPPGNLQDNPQLGRATAANISQDDSSESHRHVFNQPVLKL